MHSGGYDMALVTNSSAVAREVAVMTQGVMLQEAMERGGQEQWKKDVRWALIVLTVHEPSRPIKFGDDRGA